MINYVNKEYWASNLETMAFFEGKTAYENTNLLNAIFRTVCASSSLSVFGTGHTISLEDASEFAWYKFDFYRTLAIIATFGFRIIPKLSWSYAPDEVTWLS